MHVLVQDNPARRRFEVLVDGRPGGYAAYQVRDGAVVMTHTEVDPVHRGQGVGQQLARETLDQLRDRGERVVPQCPFFARYVEAHPEYADLVTVA
jgi:hypothetical protein